MNDIFGLSKATKWVGAVVGNRFVKRVAGGHSQCSVVGERADGVSLFDGADGTFGTVHLFGVADITAGAAVADGDRVMTDASGQAITFAAGGGGRYYLGYADAPASGSGASLSVQLYPPTTAG